MDKQSRNGLPEQCLFMNANGEIMSIEYGKPGFRRSELSTENRKANREIVNSYNEQRGITVERVKMMHHGALLGWDTLQPPYQEESDVQNGRILEIEISRPGSFGAETSSTLELPAAPYEVLDALDKSRITDERVIYSAEIINVELDYLPQFIGTNVNLNELNHLAQRLTSLSRQSFSLIDGAIAIVNAQMENGDSLDDYRVKAIFYSLFFGADSPSRVEHRKYVDCFVTYEERTRTVENDDGMTSEETYTVAVPIASLTAIYNNIRSLFGRAITYEDQANANEIYYRALYGTGAPTEDDDSTMWEDWTPDQLDGFFSDFPAGEVGAEAVRLGLSRLGDPYSQELRGQGNYTDCSYLVRWVYKKLGVNLPGTAAAQGKYCVDNGLTISQSSLAPGDLVFWSHKPNGRFLNITHVGIYAGNGKVVDASSSRGEVVYRDLFDSGKQVLYARPYADTQKSSAGGFISPLGNGWRSMVTSEFGGRTDPLTGARAGHTGIDLGASKGTAIRSAKAGTVKTVVYGSTGYGYDVTVDHGDGMVTLYGHCSQILVREGQTVKAGETIAKVGSTGRSTGNHLHFEVRVNGVQKNPRNYLP